MFDHLQFVVRCCFQNTRKNAPDRHGSFEVICLPIFASGLSSSKQSQDALAWQVGGKSNIARTEPYSKHLTTTSRHTHKYCIRIRSCKAHPHNPFHPALSEQVFLRPKLASPAAAVPSIALLERTPCPSGWRHSWQPPRKSSRNRCRGSRGWCGLACCWMPGRWMGRGVGGPGLDAERVGVSLEVS